MANPIKAQDPAAAALSAIEEALNLSDLSEPAVTGEGEAARSAPGFEVSPDDRLNHPLLSPRSGGDTVRPKLPSMDDATCLSRAGPQLRRCAVGDARAASARSLAGPRGGRAGDPAGQR